MDSESVTLKTLLDFLSLCEASGYIEYKLPFPQIQESIRTLWNAMSPKNHSVVETSHHLSQIDTPSVTSLQAASFAAKLTPQTPLSSRDSLSSIDAFLTIKTPEVASTPMMGAPSIHDDVGASPSLSDISHDPQHLLETASNVSVSVTESDDVLDRERDVSIVGEEDSGRCGYESDTPVECDNHHADHSEISQLSLSHASHCSDSSQQLSHGSPGFPGTANNDSSVSIAHVCVSEEEKESNGGSFIKGDDFNRCQLDTPGEGDDDVCRDTSQVPLFDLSDTSNAVELCESDPESSLGVNDEQITSKHDSESDCTASDDHVDSPSGGSHGDDKVGGALELERSHDVLVISSSEDESDDKLENLFSDMKIQSTKKNVRKHIPSRKSLSVFIVSDSEDAEVDFSDGDAIQKENVCSPRSPHLTTPTYSTPYTPYTGVVFWGSPDVSTNLDSKKIHTKTKGIKSHKKPPLRERNYLTTCTPGEDRRVSVTTPSAGRLFGRFKNNMIQELFTLFNSTVFDNKLPSDMEIIWNKKLRTTAGYCCYLGFMSARTARIELSTKVIDCYGRVRDTLIHEMCHAANWIIDGIKDGGHGRKWRKWADKAQSAHPGLKPVERCHHYEIQYKYTYKCTVCDFKIGRHSKSVNLRTARCPYCLSTLELLPKMKADGTPLVANRYAQFIKDHYGDVKGGSPWRSHKQVLEKIREMYHSSTAEQTDVGGAH